MKDAVRPWRYVVFAVAAVAMGVLVWAVGMRQGGGDASLGMVQQVLDHNREQLSRIAELENDAYLAKRQAEEAAKDVETLEASLWALQVVSGDTDVTGEGVVLRVNPGSAGGQVLDVELLQLVNELNAAGAEAISINGQRVVPFTSIRTVGDQVQINRIAMSAPFVVQAIGNAQTLSHALELYGGVLENLRANLDITLDMQESVSIPRYEGEVTFRYAQGVQSQQ